MKTERKRERERERQTDRERDKDMCKETRESKRDICIVSWQFTVLLPVFTPLGQSDPWLTAGDQSTSWKTEIK